MRTEDQVWMTYIDSEVGAACDAKGWAHQIRRKWSVREKPVSRSSIDDYEWKLIPDARGKLPDAPHGDFDGEYYVLGFSDADCTFVFQHDTTHVSIWGPHWERETYTRIDARQALKSLPRRGSRGRGSRPPAETPPAGWLRDHLLYLVAAFKQNSFSIT